MLSLKHALRFVSPVGRLSSLRLLEASSIVPSSSHQLSQRRTLTKDYDKVIKLEPEDIEYKYEDSRFLKGPNWADEPYIKHTEEEILELTKVKLEREIFEESVITSVDPEAEPFAQVLEGREDGGRFTQAEVIPDLEIRWPWVERLLPKPLLTKPIRADSVLIAQLPTSPPSGPYFIARTRSRLYPLYRKYEVINRDDKRYWRNRWDGMFNKYHTDILDNMDEIKWENNEETITLTEVTKIQGDIWAFEEEARQFLESRGKVKEGERILSAVNEVRGKVEFKGDFIEDLALFFKQKGF